MPNTIAHFAVNGLVTRRLLPEASLPLIYAGCVVPDLPWILQRAINGLNPGADVYDVRLYCINQASLISCAVFSLAVALLFARWRMAFSILALGSLLHLLLDACQVKWSNGVSLLVPWSWSLLNFGLFWPESVWTVLLTVSGLIYYLAMFGKATAPLPAFSRNPWRMAVAGALLAGWLVLPTFWMDDAFAANNHCVATLHPDHSGERPGKAVELDRIPFLSSKDGGGDLVIFGGERVHSEGFDPGHDAKVSVQGRFSEVDRIVVSNSHIHHSWLREAASYGGLALVALVWLKSPMRRFQAMVRDRNSRAETLNIS